jgi:hypothetical protein
MDARLPTLAWYALGRFCAVRGLNLLFECVGKWPQAARGSTKKSHDRALIST